MSLRWTAGVVFAVVAALVGGLVLGMSLSQPAHAGGGGKDTGTATRTREAYNPFTGRSASITRTYRR